MEEKGLPWYLGVNALVPALSSESLCFAAKWIKGISGRKEARCLQSAGFAAQKSTYEIH
jgi:hypothetical protein